MSNIISQRMTLPVGILVLMLLSFSGCVKNNIDLDNISNTVDWDATLGIPLAYGNLSFKDLFSSYDSTGAIKTYDDGTFGIIYRKQLFSQSANSVVAIPDQTFHQDFTCGVSGSDIFTGFPIHVPADTIPYSLQLNNLMEIDTILFKAGVLTFNINTQIKHPGYIIIDFPTLRKDGKSLKFTVNLTGLGSFSATTNYDITGYAFSSKYKNTINQCPIAFEFALNGSTPAMVAGEKISVDVNLQSIAFKTLIGYVGTYNLLDLTDKVKITMFESSNTSNIVLADPRLNVYLQNAFGLPVQITQNDTALTTKNNITTKTAVTFSKNNPFTIKYPSNAQIGQTAYDTIRIDTISSNLRNVLASTPQYFQYSIKGASNPAGKTSERNFVTDSSHLDIDMEVEIPFNFKAGLLEFKDTVGFDMGSMVTDFSIVKQLALYTTFNNTMPFDLKVMVYLANENKVVVDTLYGVANQPLIQSASVDAKGTVLKATSKLTQMIFDNTTAKKFQDVKYAFIRASMTTANQGMTFVKFTNKQSLQVYFQFQAQLNVTSLKQL